MFLSSFLRITFLVLAPFGMVVPALGAQWNTFLPDNTEAVIVLNVRQISESPVFKKYFREQWENAARNNPEDRPFFNMMDADSIKEIVRITLALPPGPFNKKAVVIVQGRF